MLATAHGRKEPDSSLKDILHRNAGLAQLSSHLATAVWRGSDRVSARHAVVPIRFAALDAQLPSGG